jgi:hypothetical protein
VERGPINNPVLLVLEAAQIGDKPLPFIAAVGREISREVGQGMRIRILKKRLKVKLIF